MKSFTSYQFCLFLKYLLLFSPSQNIQMLKMDYSEETSIGVSSATIPYHLNFPSMLLHKCVLKNTFFRYIHCKHALLSWLCDHHSAVSPIFSQKHQAQMVNPTVLKKEYFDTVLPVQSMCFTQNWMTPITHSSTVISLSFSSVQTERRNTSKFTEHNLALLLCDD